MDATRIPEPPPGAPPPVDPRRQEYRRRQRRRAIVAWSVAGLLVLFIGLAVAFGGGESGSRPDARIFPAEMSSAQYERLHKGEGQASVLTAVGNPGLREDEVEEVDLLPMFPPPPAGSSCEFWSLSDAPDHLVRLCFSEAEGSLLQKVVRAPGEGGAETTLT